jgi:hypothetical protein
MSRSAMIWVAMAAVAGLLFVLGIALGQALKDNPRPGLTVTHSTTLTP